MRRVRQVAVALATAALCAASGASLHAEPVGFQGISIENLVAIYDNYTAGNPNVSSSRTRNRYDTSIYIQAFEGGTFLTTPSFQTKSCKVDGVLQTPSFAYRMDKAQRDKFNCKTKDENETGSYTTTINGTFKFDNVVLSLNGQIAQSGSYRLHFAPDRKTSYKVQSDQRIVVKIAGKKCSVKKLDFSSRHTSSAPETSKHYASRSDDKMTISITNKTSCKLY